MGNLEDMNTAGVKLPLTGITVLDLTRVRSGPTAVRQLADYGADVIKVEPFAGDAYRQLSKPWRTDYNWQLTSRNKRSIALDLNLPKGQAVMEKLIAGADVLVGGAGGRPARSSGKASAESVARAALSSLGKKRVEVVGASNKAYALALKVLPGPIKRALISVSDKSGVVEVTSSNVCTL